MDDFEEILKRQTFRPVPPDLRAEILAAASAPAQPAVSALPKRVPASTPRPWWCAWLWPSPYAWAALAAIWILLAVVQFGTQSTTERIRLARHQPASPPREWVASLAEQRQLLQDLFRETARPLAPVLPPLAPAERGACLDPRRRDGLAFA